MRKSDLCPDARAQIAEIERYRRELIERRYQEWRREMGLAK